MLIIRVCCAVIFGSFALWAQVPETNSSTSSPLVLNAADRCSSESALPLETSEAQPDEGLPHFTLFDDSSGQPKFDTAPAQAASTTSPPKATAYKGYVTRRKIHRYASIATLPLFVSESIVGQKLFDETTAGSGSLRGVHSGLAAGIGVLFGVNTVTGIWNLKEMGKAPGYRRRLFHSVLMLAADAGFVTTAALAPHRDRTGVITDSGRASAHRAAAFASFGVATVGYVYMLLTK